MSLINNSRLVAASLDEKLHSFKELLAEFNPSDIEVFDSPTLGYRCRAEFAIWHRKYNLKHVMFRKLDNKNKLSIYLNQFPIANSLINKAMAVIKNKLRNKNPQTTSLKHKLFQIEYLSNPQPNLRQLVITLIYHKKLDQEADLWLKQAKLLQQQLAIACNAEVSIIGRSRKFKIALGSSEIIQEIATSDANYQIKLIEGSFCQPNPLINLKMINWVNDYLKGVTVKDILELYCGVGNFSMMLATRARQLLATEVNKPAVKAALYSLQKNNISNCKVVSLSAEEVTQAFNREREFNRLKFAQVNLDSYDFNTVFVDPPRSGIDSESLAFIARFDRIVYISCNAVTLADNLKQLSTTHRIVKTAVFDQFPNTHHLESGVILEKIDVR